MDKWIYYHKRTIKKIGIGLTILGLIIYAVLVWDATYLFMKNYDVGGFNEIKINEPFEYKGLEITIKGCEIFTAKQATEKYGNPEMVMYDMEGNEVYMDALDSNLTYIRVDYNLKKLVDEPEFDMTDIIIHDNRCNACLCKEFHDLLLGDDSINMSEIEKGTTLYNRKMGMCLNDILRYNDDLYDDDLYLVFPGYMKGMQPIRIKIN